MPGKAPVKDHPIVDFKLANGSEIAEFQKLLPLLPGVRLPNSHHAIPSLDMPIENLRLGNFAYTLKYKGETIGFVWIVERGRSETGDVFVGIKGGIKKWNGAVATTVREFLRTHNFPRRALIFETSRNPDRHLTRILETMGFRRHPNVNTQYVMPFNRFNGVHTIEKCKIKR